MPDLKAPEINEGGSAIAGVASQDSQWPASVQTRASAGLRIGLAVAILVALGLGAHLLQVTEGRGAVASLSLLFGVGLGITFQRGRFCFFCIFRDFFEHRNSAPLYAILAALAAGGIGYAIVMSTFLPNASLGRLPPGAHIGPVSWPLVVAGLAFGLGMALSGACISGHLYRVGEGSSRAPIALIGALLGFGLGFYTWNELYLTAISESPVLWLPSQLGYGGALIVHLVVIGVLALILLRWIPAQPAQSETSLTIRRVRDIVLKERWNPLITGAIVGIIGVFGYLRVEPLGVTAQLGSISRTILNNVGVLPEQLNGLDTIAGCATQVVDTITSNGLLVSGLVLGALAAGLLSNRFQFSRLSFSNSASALLGGVLMGWGAMTALGCTVGVLLSGISAFAVSGWVFGAAVVISVWLSIKLKLHTRWES